MPSFRLAVKRRLLDLEMTVTELAARLGLSRTAVSLAINHESLFLGVKKRIREVLEMGGQAEDAERGEGETRTVLRQGSGLQGMEN